jgi:hypothetical protein
MMHAITSCEWRERGKGVVLPSSTDTSSLDLRSLRFGTKTIQDEL